MNYIKIAEPSQVEFVIKGEEANSMQINSLRKFMTLKEKYFQWRYWGYIYNRMKKEINNKHVKTEKELIRYINKPGIVLSFDDSYRVYDWIKYGKELFGYYDVKVTFNINAFHHFEGNREHNQTEIDLLLDLQANGHEIGHHGFNHKKAVDYSTEFGLGRWVDDEIVQLFNWMENQLHSKTGERFKKPISYAFPHFVYNEQNILELIPNYFKIVRGYKDKDNLTPFNHTGFAPSFHLDGYYKHNLYYLKKIMKLSRKSGKNLIITLHSILPDYINWEDFGWGVESDSSGRCRITPKVIEEIINEARKVGLEFYTTAEIAGIATFIDPNFEKAIREIISNPNERWIPISELIQIKQLDLCNRDIKNLDGIQYFLNLESLNLANNQITDFRLLEKLPKLSNLNIENNNLQTYLDR
jgi:peptidoglycan/xylan/chitin deacetylase (PgdA/CDA1 family)